MPIFRPCCCEKPRPPTVLEGVLVQDEFDAFGQPPVTPPMGSEGTWAADAQRGRFAAVLTRVRGNGRMGLLLQCFDSEPARILEAESDTTTAAGLYNESTAAELQLRVGDYIVEVEGREPGSSIPDSLVSPSRPAVTVLIARPSVVTVEFARDLEPLGLQLKQHRGGMCILVEDVEREPATNSSAVDIRPGDRILGLTGISVDAERGCVTWSARSTSAWRSPALCPRRAARTCRMPPTLSLTKRALR